MLTAHYRGDCSDVVIGQVMGPDLAMGWVQAIDATFYPETGRTMVRFRPIGADLAALATRRPGITGAARLFHLDTVPALG